MEWNGVEWSGMEWNGVEIRRLYLPTVESYGRGAWFDLFFRFESRCSRDSVLGFQIYSFQSSQ